MTSDSLIDLRSDTVTRPTPPMRQAMANAEVGDDVYGDDPTVNALQAYTADLFGREAALFVPSGIMATQIWLHVLAQPGSEVLAESNAHLVALEDGAGPVNAAVQFRTVDGDARGRLSVAALSAARRPSSFPFVSQAVVSIEETTNLGGGALHTAAGVAAIQTWARDENLRVHIDGARIFNAIVAGGGSAAEYGAACDGLSFCLSKGLGAPVGSMMVGDADDIALAVRWRRRMGGALRQVGVLAAAGQYALDHHVTRLADDHANATSIAAVLGDRVPGSVTPGDVNTNIVYIDTGAVAAADVVVAAKDRGLLIGAMGPTSLRAVTHLDVTADQAHDAATTLADLLTN